jgi:hypothetical protein
MLARNGEGRNASVMKATCATEGLVVHGDGTVS